MCRGAFYIFVSSHWLACPLVVCLTLYEKLIRQRILPTAFKLQVTTKPVFHIVKSSWRPAKSETGCSDSGKTCLRDQTLTLTPGYHGSLAMFGCSRMGYVRTALQCFSNQHLWAGVGTMLKCSLVGHSNHCNINILLGSLTVELLFRSRKLYICVLDTV